MQAEVVKAEKVEKGRLLKEEEEELLKEEEEELLKEELARSPRPNYEQRKRQKNREGTIGHVWQRTSWKS